MKKQISIQDSIAFVSGANRGIGKAITEELLNKGAKKVYAGARKKESLNELTEKYGDRVVAVQLDVSNQESVNQAAKEASDATMLINNAGVLAQGGYNTNDMAEGLKKNMEVNVYGVARLTQAVLPNIKKQPNAAIVTVSSVAGLANMPLESSYSVSKAAAHSLIQGLRGDLKESNVLVSGIYPGPIDSDMTNIEKFAAIEKDSPQNLAKNVVSALEQGEEDIFPDVMAEQVKQAYSSSPKQVEEMFSEWR